MFVYEEFCIFAGKMDSTLKALYLRLDTNSKYLTRKAEAQLVVKIIYNNGANGINLPSIMHSYKKLVKCANESVIQTILDELVAASEISLKKNLYSLSESKRKSIENAQKQSEERLSYILELLRPYQSDDADVKEWLVDSLVIFFEMFSDDWMSDLCYKINAIVRRKDSILDVIGNRTNHNKKIARLDKTSLPKALISVLLEENPEVSALLWEYGMAAFSSKLIKNSHTLDDLAFDTFKDSSCILDTNLLFAISLASHKSHDKENIHILERVFSSLQIKVGVLYITKKEYEIAVGIKREALLKLVASYDIDVLKEIDDDLLKTAISCGCVTEDSFKRFFDAMLDLPKVVWDEVSITLLDNSSLDAAIKAGQNDQKKNEELNAIFKNVVGYDKKEQALKHDVGLISGTEHLRTTGRYFILSQEVSVNTYAQRKPSQENLPMAIRIDTLLNVLALGGGGIMQSKDFETLFATMIRLGLQPNSKDTYTIADLSVMLDKNEEISKLSSDAIKDIAQEIHRHRLLGKSEQDITMLMTRRIQGEKLRIRDTLKITKEKLQTEQRENKRFEKLNRGLSSALKDRIEKEVRKDYRKGIIYWYVRKVLVFFVSIVLITLGVLLSGIHDFIVWAVMGLLGITLNYFIQPYVPFIGKKPSGSEEEIASEVERRIESETSRECS